jgi:hypothetical protein
MTSTEEDCSAGKRAEHGIIQLCKADYPRCFADYPLHFADDYRMTDTADRTATNGDCQRQKQLQRAGKK